MGHATRVAAHRPEWHCSQPCGRHRICFRSCAALFAKLHAPILMAGRRLARGDRLVELRLEDRDVQHVALDGDEHRVLSVSESHLERVPTDGVTAQVASHAA